MTPAEPASFQEQKSVTRFILGVYVTGPRAIPSTEIRGALRKEFELVGTNRDEEDA